ncbi:hypothetical protein NST74_11840 [Paenibacillus sp. FSL F4-0125]|uniref:hypothetical protein n=1 Tax=Paenibacillus TaxID=44249 RepID=UPI0014832A6C|nr:MULTISPECIES: hypothetical protein [Paenibacillus]
MSNKQAKAVSSNPLGLKLGLQGSAFPMMRTEIILRAEPRTKGFLLQVINTKSG